MKKSIKKTKIKLQKRKKKSRYYYLDKLVGLIDNKTKKKNNFANKIDEIVYAEENL